jgi:hypothetical protein
MEREGGAVLSCLKTSAKPQLLLLRYSALLYNTAVVLKYFVQTLISKFWV